MKLLSAAWLAATDLERLPCRQDLEAREANGERPFLSRLGEGVGRGAPS